MHSLHGLRRCLFNHNRQPHTNLDCVTPVTITYHFTYTKHKNACLIDKKNKTLVKLCVKSSKASTYNLPGVIPQLFTEQDFSHTSYSKNTKQCEQSWTRCRKSFSCDTIIPVAQDEIASCFVQYQHLPGCEHRSG